MKLLVLASTLVLAGPVLESLPNWLHSSETRETLQDYGSTQNEASVAPPQGFRVPAEYEPVDAVVISYMTFTPMLLQIAKTVTTLSNAQVWAVNGPFNLNGVNQSLYKRLVYQLDSVWMRDYGAVGVTSQGKVGYLDTVYRHYKYRFRDDKLPTALSSWQNMSVYPTPLILDGGNYMLDSVGNLFMTSVTYNWNKERSVSEIHALLKEYFGVNRVHVLEYAGFPNSPSDGTGHIDMFCKLLDDNTVLIATAVSEPYRTNGLKAIKYFQSLTAPSGSPYTILTVNGFEIDKVWYTYTNSLIVNNVVLMPQYSEDSQYEKAAVEQYKKGIPSATVVGINSDASIVNGGSVHCVTQTVPKIA